MLASTATAPNSTSRHAPERLGAILDRVAAGWRIPDRAERERDRRVLETFLEPGVAAAIAAMPVVVMDLEAVAPLSLRVDAWLWRTSQLLAAGTPAASDIEWIDNLPAIREWAARNEQDGA